MLKPSFPRSQPNPQEVWLRVVCAMLPLKVGTTGSLTVADDIRKEYVKRFPEPPEPAKNS